MKKTRYAYRIYLTLRDSLDAGVAVAESDLGVLYSWLNRSWTFALQIQDAFRINGGKMTSIKGHIYLSF